MRLLIDTHALIWAVEEPARLGSAARAAMQNPANDLIVSVSTAWEISIKSGLGKLRLSGPFRPWIEQTIADLGADLLSITIEHADAQASLPHHHRDPFDRLLVGQAIVEGLTIVSAVRGSCPSLVPVDRTVVPPS